MDIDNEETQKGKSFPWGPALGLVAIVAIGVIGFAVTRNRPSPEPDPAVTVAPRHKPAVTEAPQADPKPEPVYVDIRSLVADAKRGEADEPITLPVTPRSATPRATTPRLGTSRGPTPSAATHHPAAPEPAAEVPTTVAKGTGVIAVKKGGKSVVATVAKVADKPVDPPSATGSDNAPQDSTAAAAPTTKPVAAPRIYGEQPPQPVVDPNEVQMPFQRKRPTPRPPAAGN